MSSTTPTAPAATSSATTSASSPDYNSKFREKDLNSASCRKCVQVLQEIISGLHANNNNNSIEKNYSSTTNSHHPTTVGGTHQTSDPHRESLPLTLLKAIAETGGSSSSSSSSTSNLNIQETHDGVRVEIPVTTSLPVMLRRWSSMVRSNHRSGSERQIDDEERERDDKELHSLQTLATSSSSPMSPTTSLPSQSQQQHQQQPSSLSIELKCRTCSNTGPEGGARAFLMGPTPLSIILCHNRIQSSREEVEEILTHEFVHLYDVQTLQLDLQQCETLAYSEIRAAKAAECRHLSSTVSSSLSLSSSLSSSSSSNPWSHHVQRYCVQQKAMNATKNLFPRDGRRCIATVFAQAYQDERPFVDPTRRRSSNDTNHCPSKNQIHRSQHDNNNNNNNNNRHQQHHPAANVPSSSR